MSSTKIHPPPPPLRTNILSNTFPDEVARHIHSFHALTNVRSALPQRDQWTVLASFFSFEASSTEESHRGDGTVEVLTMATGVKCLGGVLQREERDVVLVDMHAEILARRELELLLVEEISAILAEERNADLENTRPPHGPFRVLEPCTTIKSNVRPSPTKFRKRPAVQLYLYTSHAPCGPASSAAHLTRLQKEDDYIAACVSKTLGARVEAPPEPETSHSSYRLSKLEPYPVPAKKPSRADAVPTTAYTCSDKLSRYQVLGFQGGRLARFMDYGEGQVDAEGDSCGDDAAIRLDGIVVGEDYDEAGVRLLFGSAGRADFGPSRLIEGVEAITTNQTDPAGLRYLRTLPTRTFQIWHTSVLFTHGRAVSLSRHRDPLSQPPIPIPSHIDPHSPLPLLRDALIKPPPVAPFSVASSWHRGSTFQVIGPTGILAGVSKKKVEQGGDMARWSRVCRRSMWETLRELEAVLGSEGVGKGNDGWRTVSKWMEERGPFRDWHPTK